MRRLELAADAALNKPAQGSFNIGDEPAVKAELDRLKVENQLLRQELLEVSTAHDELKKTSDTVAVRLDKTIDDISIVLGQ